jgi:hypothetical protein
MSAHQTASSQCWSFAPEPPHDFLELIPPGAETGGDEVALCLFGGAGVLVPDDLSDAGPGKWYSLARLSWVWPSRAFAPICWSRSVLSGLVRGTRLRKGSRRADKTSVAGTGGVAARHVARHCTDLEREPRPAQGAGQSAQVSPIGGGAARPTLGARPSSWPGPYAPRAAPRPGRSCTKTTGERPATQSPHGRDRRPGVRGGSGAAGPAWRSDRQAGAYPPAARRPRAGTRHGRRAGTVARCHRDQDVAGFVPVVSAGLQTLAAWPGTLAVAGPSGPAT